MQEDAQRVAAAPQAPTRHPLNVDFTWQRAPGTKLRRLTPQQFDDYNDLGFTRIENAFTPAEIAAVTAAIDPIEQRREQYMKEHQGGRVRLSEADIITFTVHIVRESPVLSAFAAHPAIKDVCHDLIGDDVRLYWDQSVYKKTSKPQEFPWHQDNGYTFIEPQQYLTLWIPLVDVDDENGCPWIAPGMHKLGTLRALAHEHRQAVPRERAERSVRAGEGGRHHRRSLRSRRIARDRTCSKDTVRKAYILQYAPDGAYAIAEDGSTITQTDPERQFKILDGGR